MKIQELRRFLTGKDNHWDYENYSLLISSDANNKKLLDRMYEDMEELLPPIKPTAQKTIPKISQHSYNEYYYQISELLAFIYASVNDDWNVVKGADIKRDREHFFLKSGNYIYDPSLAIFVLEEDYYKKYRPIQEINNSDIKEYLSQNNNLYKFYNRFGNLGMEKHKDFSIKFIEQIRSQFMNNLKSKYEITPQNVEKIKTIGDTAIKCSLTNRREYQLESENIFIHPDVDDSILAVIETDTEKISKIVQEKFPRIPCSYKKNTSRNCYALSILYSLYSDKFKLIQGGYVYKRYNEFFPNKPDGEFYQHSWLENDVVVYDPEKRIVVPKDLYYKIFTKEDEYTQKQTMEMMRRVGFNFTYLSHFISGARIGNDESIMYRFAKDRINTPQKCEEGNRIISAFDRAER